MSVSEAHLRRLLDEAEHIQGRMLPAFQELYRLCLPHRDQDPVSAQRASWAAFPALAVQEHIARIVSAVFTPTHPWCEARVDGYYDEDLSRELSTRTRAWLPAISTVLGDASIGIGALRVAIGATGAIVIEAVPHERLLHHLPGTGEEVVGQRVEFSKEDRRVYERLYGVDLEGEYGLYEVQIVDPLGRGSWHLLTGRRRLLRSVEVTHRRQTPFVPFVWLPLEKGYGVGPMFLLWRDLRTLAYLRRHMVTGIAYRALPPISYEEAVPRGDAGVEIEPGAWIPRDPTEEPPTPIAVAGDLGYGLQDEQMLEERIKRALGLDQLGPIVGTPKTATEILQRQAEVARVLGAPFGRIVSALERMAERYLELATRTVMGRWRKPLEEGRIVLDASGGRMKAEAQSELSELQSFIALIATTMGPQAVPAVLDVQAVLKRIAKLLGLPEDLVRSEQEALQVMQALQGAPEGGTNGQQP